MLLRRICRENQSGQIKAMVCVALTTSMLAVPAAAPGDLRGAIVDELGAEMWTSHVVIRDDLAGNTSGAKSAIRMLTTLDDGKFTARLDPGFYDVCVMSDAFQAVCKKVKIVDGKPTDVRFILKTDPDVFRAIGDPVGIIPDRRRR